MQERERVGRAGRGDMERKGEVEGAYTSKNNK